MRRFIISLSCILLLAATLACNLPDVSQLIAAISPSPSDTPPTETPAVPDEPNCPGNALVNGGFEQGDVGWIYSGTEHGQAIPALEFLQGTGNVHGGDLAAKLGGYETSSDNLSQTFVVPENSQLSLWWIYRSPDPIKDRDYLGARLILPNNEDGLPVFFAGGDAPQETWQQTMLDLSDYAGQRLTLEFSTFNDNYYAGWIAVDDICVQPVP
jgi:hypothetical protein